MPRKLSKTHILALWFWNEILKREDENPWKSPAFPRYLAESKRALKTLSLDMEVLKESLIAMRVSGRYGPIQSLLLPTIMSHHTNGPCWYEYTERLINTPPPVYDRHAFREWCEKNNRQDLLEALENSNG